MPKMNGLEFFKKSIQKFGYLPFVMLTAHAESSFTTEALRLGAIDYSIKPFNLDDFTQKLPIWIEIGKRQMKLHQEQNGLSGRMELLFRLKNTSLRKEE